MLDDCRECGARLGWVPGLEQQLPEAQQAACLLRRISHRAPIHGPPFEQCFIEPMSDAGGQHETVMRMPSERCETLSIGKARRTTRIAKYLRIVAVHLGQSDE